MVVFKTYLPPPKKKLIGAYLFFKNKTPSQRVGYTLSYANLITISVARVFTAYVSMEPTRQSLISTNYILTAKSRYYTVDESRVYRVGACTG